MSQHPNAELFYFMLMPEDFAFGIVYKRYWDQNECLDDCFDGSEELDEALPEGFHNAAESTWHYRDNDEATFQEGRQKLLAAGFEQIANPWL